MKITLRGIEIDPADDGTSHINVWSKGKTELGRLLTNFAYTSFRHPEHGTFASVEAYWYWLKTGMQHNSLRRLYDFSAKSSGRKFPVVAMDPEEFHRQIKVALRCKAEQNSHVGQQLRDSELPLVHYFLYNGTVVVSNDIHDWQMEYWEELRAEFKAAAIKVAEAEVKKAQVDL